MNYGRTGRLRRTHCTRRMTACLPVAPPIPVAPRRAESFLPIHLYDALNGVAAASG